MVEKFTVEAHGQREWAWLLALYLFFGSLGGWVYLLYRLLALPLGFALVSLALVLGGVVTLLFKLGSPGRAWRAIFRPGTSWISRGVLFVTGFLVCGGLLVTPSLAPWVPALTLLPWREGSAGGEVLGWLAGLFALLTTIYPGLVVSNSRAIPFWNTPLLPVLFFTYAAMGAAGIGLLGGAGGASMRGLAAGLIVLNAVLLAAYVAAMRRAGGSAQESVRRLGWAPLAAVFWLGVVAVGLAVPLALIGLTATLAPVAGAGLLIGGFLLRYCVLKAGVYVPPPLVSAKVDFSTLNRTSADLQREYSAWQFTRPATVQEG